MHRSEGMFSHVATHIIAGRFIAKLVSPCACCHYMLILYSMFPVKKSTQDGNVRRTGKLKGTDISSGQTTMSKLFCSLPEKGSTLEGNNLLLEEAFFHIQ